MFVVTEILPEILILSCKLVMILVFQHLYGSKE
jgi:hypothetical protein